MAPLSIFRTTALSQLTKMSSTYVRLATLSGYIFLFIFIMMTIVHLKCNGFHLLSVCAHVCVGVCATCVHACVHTCIHMHQFISGGQRATYRSWFVSSTMCGPGTELRSSVRLGGRHLCLLILPSQIQSSFKLSLTICKRNSNKVNLKINRNIESNSPNYLPHLLLIKHFDLVPSMYITFLINGMFIQLFISKVSR